MAEDLGDVGRGAPGKLGWCLKARLGVPGWRALVEDAVGVSGKRSVLAAHTVGILGCGCTTAADGVLGCCFAPRRLRAAVAAASGGGNRAEAGGGFDDGLFRSSLDSTDGGLSSDSCTDARDSAAGLRFGETVGNELEENPSFILAACLSASLLSVQICPAEDAVDDTALGT